MTVFGNKVCTFKGCDRPAVAHIETVHKYKGAESIHCWNAVCQLHLACVREPDEAAALKLLQDIQSGKVTSIQQITGEIDFQYHSLA